MSDAVLLLIGTLAAVASLVDSATGKRLPRAVQALLYMLLPAALIYTALS